MSGLRGLGDWRCTRCSASVLFVEVLDGWKVGFPDLKSHQEESRAAKLADLERMVLKKSLGKGNMNQKDYKRIVFLDQKTN